MCTAGGNIAPVVTISSPTATSVVAGTAINFSGAVIDDDITASSLIWTSSIMGQIGTGGSFSRNDLTVGTHDITASVVDGGGLTGSSTVTITVTQAGGGTTMDLLLAGRKVKGVITVDLTWSGATSINIDIFRNDVKILTTPNDRAHSDATGIKGGASLTYKVCEAGTLTCSPPRIIVF